jgi:hypothetical protein
MGAWPRYRPWPIHFYWQEGQVKKFPTRTFIQAPGQISHWLAKMAEFLAGARLFPGSAPTGKKGISFPGRAEYNQARNNRPATVCRPEAAAGIRPTRLYQKS